MTPPEERSLSLAEWLVLCLVCEQPRHGFAIARLLDSDGSLGQVWRVPKPVIYRALQRLGQLGMVRTAQQQASNQGPVRSLVDATGAGQQAAAAWLARPVSHTRDVRSELLVKLALADRAGADPRPLVAAQREHLPRSPARCANGWARAAGSTGRSPCGGMRRCPPPCGSSTRCPQRSPRRSGSGRPPVADVRCCWPHGKEAGGFLVGARRSR